jgi:hypothetical protein
MLMISPGSAASIAACTVAKRQPVAQTSHVTLMLHGAAHTVSDCEQPQRRPVSNTQAEPGPVTAAQSASRVQLSLQRSIRPQKVAPLVVVLQVQLAFPLQPGTLVSQKFSPAAQVPWPLQTPATHVSSGKQDVSQPPQLRGSVCVFTQRLPQRSGALAGQPHFPATQDSPCAHLLPQPPQLAGSVWMSAQAPPGGWPQQVAAGAAHRWPAPQAQAWLAQRLPRGAQSWSRQQMPAKQEPPQQTLPAPHWASPVQATQVWFALQIGVGFRQGPQFMVRPQPSGTAPQSTPTSQVVLLWVQHRSVSASQTCPTAQQPSWQVWRGAGQTH